VTAANVEELVRPVDLVLDGTDNVATRYLLNDACVKLGKPWIYGGVAGTGGLACAVVPGKGPCLRCLFPEPPAAAEVPNCNRDGVLNTAVTQVASLQVTLACQFLLGLPVAGTLVNLDVWSMRQHRSRVERDPACPCCGRHEFPFLADSAEPLAVSICGRDAVRIAARFWREYGIAAATLPGQLRRARAQVDELGLLHDIRADNRHFTLFPDGTVLAHGGTDTTAALAALKRLATALGKPFLTTDHTD
jgi:adenylyltransferase/sulfurtransferase